MKLVYVIDNFYLKPNQVRELALEADFYGIGQLSQNFPGQETLHPFYSDDIVKKIESIIGKKITFGHDHNAFGRFRKTLAADLRRTQVHFDNTDWAAVVYLTPVTNSTAGTIFLKHISMSLAERTGPV